MLFANGPTHRKRRAPLSRAFAFRLVAELRPRIRASADELIQAAWAHGELNLLDDYAATIPARVISSILGLPAADIPHFTTLVYRMSVGLSSTFTPSQLPDIDRAAQDLTAYVDELLTARGGAAGNGFLASYIENVQEEGKLKTLETLMQIVTVILGGSDTTRAAMTMLWRRWRRGSRDCRSWEIHPLFAAMPACAALPECGSVGKDKLYDICVPTDRSAHAWR